MQVRSKSGHEVTTSAIPKSPKLLRQVVSLGSHGSSGAKSNKTYVVCNFLKPLFF